MSLSGSGSDCLSHVQQRVGLAFFLEMAACAFHFFSFLIAMLFTYFSFSGAKDISDHYSVNRSSRTNVTNVGRSALREHFSETSGLTGYNIAI